MENREDPDQTASSEFPKQSDLGLHCLSSPFWYATSVRNFRTFTIGIISDFIWPFLRPYMGVIPNPQMAFIFPISCILALIFPILINIFPM